MANRKDPSVQRNELPRPDPVLDQLFAQTEGKQLPRRDDAVLLLRQPANRRGRLSRCSRPSRG
ncbi:MAG TPA: hypothetical protein VG816_02320, partial [Solirubrobacterales bacterium]|nr:hypothetical protein [Solirubrobacterales bacterium]